MIADAGLSAVQLLLRCVECWLIYIALSCLIELLILMGRSVLLAALHSISHFLVLLVGHLAHILREDAVVLALCDAVLSTSSIARTVSPSTRPWFTCSQILISFSAAADPLLVGLLLLLLQHHVDYGAATHWIFHQAGLVVRRHSRVAWGSWALADVIFLICFLRAHGSSVGLGT